MLTVIFSQRTPNDKRNWFLDKLKSLGGYEIQKPEEKKNYFKYELKGNPGNDFGFRHGLIVFEDDDKVVSTFRRNSSSQKADQIAVLKRKLLDCRVDDKSFLEGYIRVNSIAFFQLLLDAFQKDAAEIDRCYKPKVFVTSRYRQTLDWMVPIVEEIVHEINKENETQSTSAKPVEVNRVHITTRTCVIGLKEELTQRSAVICCVNDSERKIILTKDEPSEALDVVSAVKEKYGDDGVMIVLCGNVNIETGLYNTSIFHQDFLSKQPLLHELAIDRSRFLSIERQLNSEQRNHLKNWVLKQTHPERTQTQAETARDISENVPTNEEDSDQKSSQEEISQ